jgi:signal peptidase I
MPKTKPAPAKAATKTAKSTVTDDSNSWSRTLRETVESVVIAFILAFLFRTFEAEAFVIPTGSMAPTLMGRHKDVVCPHCGYEYRTGASTEVDQDSGREIPGGHLRDATCPMCRSTIDVAPGKGHPSFSGDRIIVSKFAYDVSDPERWDVIVFKYPEDAKQNYIKRLVGMPNEMWKIHNGDIYTAPLDSNDFEIERKGKKPAKLRAMLQPVYYNDYVAEELVKANFPARWQSWAPADQTAQWVAGDNGRTFEIDGKSSARMWLRYQHLLPTPSVWHAVQNQKPFAPPPPLLIQDFYAYNAGNLRAGGPSDQLTWIGDLALTFELEVQNNQGAVLLELIKGGRQFRCTIDVATGQAKLSIDGLESFAPVAQTSIKGPGSYEVSLANVDQQLLLWVDGEVVSFDAPTTYPALQNDAPVTAPPTRGSEVATDLSPIGIAAEGGAAIKVSHLKIDRDVFYISESPAHAPEHLRMNDVKSPIKLGNDEYFMLGDNSPQSKDSRFWHTVDRSLLIGKALFIYWPHSWDEIEIGSIKIPFPYFPNFGDMGFVR